MATMIESFDLVPHKPNRMTEAAQRLQATIGVRLDPKVRAQVRRDAGDADQLAWDDSLDPAEMLKALLQQEPDPSIILPAAKFMDTANKLFGTHGQRIDPLIWTRSMQTIAKLILKGNFHTAVIFLRHACTGAGLARDPDGAYAAMTSVVREFFPNAPATWRWRGAVTPERRRLAGDEGQIPELPFEG